MKQHAVDGTGRVSPSRSSQDPVPSLLRPFAGDGQSLALQVRAPAVVYERGNIVPEGVWKRRWERLREAGLTFEQAQIVYRVLDETRAFGYQWTADTAYKDLEEAYGEVKVGNKEGQ